MSLSIFDINDRNFYIDNKINIDINEINSGMLNTLGGALSEFNALEKALHDKNYEKAKWLIEEGININYQKGRAFDTSYSSMPADIQLIMLDYGFNIHQNSEIDYPQIMEARDIDVLHKMIEMGADVNAENPYGETRIFAESNLDILTLLLDNGACINHQNSEGETALFRTSPEVISFLIEKGADTSIRDNEGNTALISSCSSDSIKILHKAGRDLNEINNAGRSVLFYSYGSRMDLDYCINHGLNINLRDCEGKNMLHYISVEDEADEQFIIDIINAGIDYKNELFDYAPEFLSNYIAGLKRVEEEKEILEEQVVVKKSLPEQKRI